MDVNDLLDNAKEIIDSLIIGNDEADKKLKWSYALISNVIYSINNKSNLLFFIIYGFMKAINGIYQIILGRH